MNLHVQSSLPSRPGENPWRSGTRPPLPPGPYLVAGLGRAGQAAVAALLPIAGAQGVRVWDEYESDRLREERERLRSIGVRVWTGDFAAALDSDPAPACLVKSPGIAPDAALIEAARERGIAVLGEMELGWRLRTTPVIGVTGTNGKSTVSHLVARCLERSGAAATITGNFGTGVPYSGLENTEEGWIVCEVSSYSLESAPEFLPDAGVFTNLTYDHLHWHGDMATYAECKRRMLVRGDRSVGLAVVNMDDALGRRLAAEVGRRGGRVLGYGTGDGEYRVRPIAWDVRSGTVEVETPDGPVVIESRLPGPHNGLNIAAALALSDGLGLERDPVVAAISTAPGVPGRFERIEEGQPFDAIVDLAHTPDAARNSLWTAREILRRRSRDGLLWSRARRAVPTRASDRG